MKTFLFRHRFYLAGAVFLGLAAACFEKHGAIEYAVDHVWDEADKINQAAPVRQED